MSSASRATANLARSSHGLLLGKRSHESDATHDEPSLRPITHRWGLLTCSCLLRPPVSRTRSTPRRASLLRLSSAERGGDEHPAKRLGDGHAFFLCFWIVAQKTGASTFSPVLGPACCSSSSAIASTS